MAITRTAMVDDDGSGTTGTIINNAWKTELYNQIDGALGSGGNWQAVPFNAAHYSAGTGGGTWTVGAAAVAESRYTTIGKTLHWSLFIAWYAGASAIAGTVTELRVQLPGGLTAAGAGSVRLARFLDVSQWVEVMASTAGGGTTINLSRVTGVAFTAGQVGFSSMMTFEVL